MGEEIIPHFRGNIEELISMLEVRESEYTAKMEEMTSTEKRNEQEISFMTKTIDKLKSYLEEKEKDHEEASNKIFSLKTVENDETSVFTRFHFVYIYHLF